MRIEDLVKLGLYVGVDAEDEKRRLLDQLRRFCLILKRCTADEVTDDIINFVKLKTKKINDRLFRQIDLILHNEEFSRFEGSWRGLVHLINNSELDASDGLLKIHVLCVSLDELSKDLLKAYDFDQSKIFKKVYDGGIGVYGGEPYGCLVCDFWFSSNSYHTSVLTALSRIGAAAHCLVICSALPSLFNISSFDKINSIVDLARVFQTMQKVYWRAFQESSDSRYVLMCLPYVMIRAPYSVESNPADGIAYNESVDYTNPGHFVWTGAHFIFAVRIATAIVLYGWPVSIIGEEGGGTANDLSVYLYSNKEGEVVLKCPTSIAITDRRERELASLGFCSLCHCKNTNKATFFSAQTCHKPEKYDDPVATQNSVACSSAPYILAGSRFIHLIKVMMQRLIGLSYTADGLEEFLRRKLSKYVLPNPAGVSHELKAKMPLRELQIKIIDNPGAVGSFSVVIWIVMHYQFSDVHVSLRIVSKLPSLKV